MLDEPPLMLSALAFAYPGMAQPLFVDVELCVDRGSRLVPISPLNNEWSILRIVFLIGPNLTASCHIKVR